MKYKILVFVLIIFYLPFFLFAQSSNDAIKLYRDGHKSQILEEYYQAIEQYKAALVINPDYTLPMKGLAECFYRIQEYDEALLFVQKVKHYDKTDLHLYNLEGLIQIGRAELDLAREQFQYVLSIEPNNIDAQFGLAELDIAYGKTREAARKYIETLNHSPNNRTALLELVTLYEELGERKTAKDYLELALKYHAEDPWVHYTAGKYFYDIEDYRLAGYYLKTAIALKSNFYSAKQLLGIVYFRDGKYTDAESIMNETLSATNPDQLHFAHYCLGLFHDKHGAASKAIREYIMALDLKYDDEIARIAAENIAIEEMDIKDHIRKNLALYHYSEGLLLDEQNYMHQALIEYRRSLILNYDSEETRFAYARIYKKLGFPIMYLMELKVLKDDYNTKDKKILDELELHLMYLYDSVSYRWIDALKAVTGEKSISDKQTGDEDFFDQYTIQQKKYNIMLFTYPDDNTLLHPFADQILIEYYKTVLFGYRNINPLNEQYEVSSFDRAFRTANEKGSDYFLLIQFTEKERSFDVNIKIFLTRTGSELETLNIFKTGNRRIQNSLVKGAERIHELLPLRGTLLTRRFNKGIIDLGRFQGINDGDELLIIKKGKLKLDHQRIAYIYEDSDVLGTFTVTEADENIAEGKIKKNSFFDFINPEDEVIVPEKKQ